MDTGKKRMLTLKKAQRDRKKLNETILKRLKTLDAEIAGASIMWWILHAGNKSIMSGNENEKKEKKNREKSSAMCDYTRSPYAGNTMQWTPGHSESLE